MGIAVVGELAAGDGDHDLGGAFLHGQGAELLGNLVVVVGEALLEGVVNVVAEGIADVGDGGNAAEVIDLAGEQAVGAGVLVPALGLAVVGELVGLGGQGHAALGNLQSLGGVDIALVDAGDRRADFDGGGVSHVGGSDIGGVRGPVAVGLLVLDLHGVAAVIRCGSGTGRMGIAVVGLGHRSAGKRYMLFSRWQCHDDRKGFGLFPKLPVTMCDFDRSCLNARYVRIAPRLGFNGHLTCAAARPGMTCAGPFPIDSDSFANFHGELIVGNGRGCHVNRVNLFLTTEPGCNLRPSALIAFDLIGRGGRLGIQRPILGVRCLFFGSALVRRAAIRSSALVAADSLTISALRLLLLLTLCAILCRVAVFRIRA